MQGAVADWLARRQQDDPLLRQTQKWNGGCLCLSGKDPTHYLMLLTKLPCGLVSQIYAKVFGLAYAERVKDPEWTIGVGAFDRCYWKGFKSEWVGWG